jgi:hypothetical protein
MNPGLALVNAFGVMSFCANRDSSSTSPDILHARAQLFLRRDAHEVELEKLRC